MEFSIGVDYPINLGRKNPIEEPKIKSKILQSKLAYIEVTDLPHPQLKIEEGDRFEVSKKRGVQNITIPSFTKDTRMANYFMRMAVDANAVKNGYLPLHAAAYNEGGATKFIFGDTHKGKSFALDILLSNSSRIVPVGDDHVIVGKNEIFGNAVMRNRRDGRDVYSYFKKDSLAPLNNYEIIVVDVTGDDASIVSNPEELLSDGNTHVAVLKYLIKQPMERDARRLFRGVATSDVLEDYQSMYESFLRGAEQISKLSGCKEYLLEEALK